MRPVVVAGFATAFLLAGWMNYIASGSLTTSVGAGAVAMLIYGALVVMGP